MIVCDPLKKYVIYLNMMKLSIFMKHQIRGIYKIKEAYM